MWFSLVRESFSAFGPPSFEVAFPVRREVAGAEGVLISNKACDLTAVTTYQFAFDLCEVQEQLLSPVHEVLIRFLCNLWI